ncbi:MAG: helix-turn-helix transcriptional regulator [Phascolarctobacterium sp.]|nr:helix-turn-helix transcriptional regulator [Phascolarctobacterium sp.]
MNIGQKIRMLRKQNNMSVEELAQKINKDRATVYRYEKGDIENLPVTILEPIAKALNVDPASLLMNTRPTLVLPPLDGDTARIVGKFLADRNALQRDLKLEIIKDIVQIDFTDEQLKTFSAFLKSLK